MLTEIRFSCVETVEIKVAVILQNSVGIISFNLILIEHAAMNHLYLFCECQLFNDNGARGLCHGSQLLVLQLHSSSPKQLGTQCTSSPSDLSDWDP